MKFASVALAALLCASAATAQQDPAPDLAPLVPPAAAPSKKAQKKTSKKKKPAPAQTTPAPAAQAKPSETSPAHPQASAEAPLPALVPLAEPPPLVKLNNSIGVLAPASLSAGLRAIAQLAPLTQSAPALTAPVKACADEACFADLGARSQVDQVVVATQESGMVRVRVIDVVARRQAGAGEAAVKTDEEALAQSEAISCRLLVPAGCTGDFSAEAPAGVELTVDGAPSTKKLPVGMHTLSARSGTSRTQRAVAILKERPASYTVDRNLRILAAGESTPGAPVAAVAGGTTPQKSPWVKRGGYALLGAGAVALVAGGAFGLKSRSDLNSAETAYRNNGGVYRASDAETLRSGNSAAKNANLLYAASAVCLVSGALLTFAF